MLGKILLHFLSIHQILPKICYLLVKLTQTVQPANKKVCTRNKKFIWENKMYYTLEIIVQQYMNSATSTMSFSVFQLLGLSNRLPAKLTN